MLVLQALVLLLLLLASALFSGSRVALFSLDGPTREALARSRDRASSRVLALVSRPQQVRITLLILNTFTRVGAVVVAAALALDLARSFDWNTTTVLIVEILALVFILILIAEITPRQIATRNPKTFSLSVSGLLTTVHTVLGPLSSRIVNTMSFIQRRFKHKNSNRLTADDLKAMAGDDQHPILDEEERDLIQSIVEFSETTVREIMVSRLDVVAVPVTATLSEALELIRTSGHSRVPLYVEHLDNIIGIVYAKDLLPFVINMTGDTRVDWHRIARPTMFVPMGKKLDDLLRDFQAKKTHMAIVVDEYGGTAGLVTMEDVLEEIVGDIRDEHDDGELALYEQIDENTYRVDARINLDDMSEIMGIELDTEEFDFETLGGLIFHVTGAIPREGDEVVYESLTMKVETVENHRIGYVLVHVNGRLEDQELYANRRTAQED